MSKPRRPRHPKASGKPYTMAPTIQIDAPVSASSESESAPTETLAEMAALAPEPAPADTIQEFVEDVVHAQESISAAVSDVSVAALEAAGATVEETAPVVPSVLHTAVEGTAEPASMPAVITVPTLVGTVTAPSVPRITALQFGAESFGTTVMSYVVGEGEAFASHMRALAGARTMADFVRLQIAEFQRAADATLTCWGRLTVSASRTAVAR